MRRRPAATEPVVVIGAGPYGLACSAHLRAAGVPTHTFGEPLAWWRHNMPKGMILRSRKRSSNIADPRRRLTIEDYERAEHKVVRQPSLLLDEFIDYGMWFQRQAVPDVDPRKVALVESSDGHFQLELDDGEKLTAARVVVAAGLSPFAYWPPAFAGLPSALVSHACEHPDLGVFADRTVLVIGAGQSALESAALLVESGATVEVLLRASAIRWLGDDTAPSPPPTKRLIRITPPPTDVGGRLSGWIAAAPDVFRRLPDSVRTWDASACVRPAGSGWLRPRLERATITHGRFVLRAEPADGRIRVALDDRSERIADHVLLGTGYAVDVTRYPFLAPQLIEKLELRGGYPLLGRGLESSVTGLHFVGAPAAASFGPINRFVVGTWYTAPALTRRVLGLRQPPLSLSF